MKFIVFSDLHASGFNYYKALNYSHQLSCVYHTLIWIAELCKKNKPDFVVCCGDIVSSNSYVEIPVNNAIFEGFSQIAKEVPVHVVMGNHDLDTRTNASSYIEALKEINNVTVYTGVKRVSINNKNLIFVPYTDDFSIIPEDLFKTAFDYAFIHLPIQGVTLAPGILDEGIDPKKFLLWNRVFAGHYHTPQDNALGYSNLYFVGSVLFSNFTENCLTAFDRGVIICDNDSVIRLPNPFTPFYTTVRNKEELLSYKRDKKRTFLRISFEPDGLDLSEFLRVYTIKAGKVENVARTNLSVNTDPAVAVKEYGKFKNFSDDVIESGIQILDSVKEDFKVKTVPVFHRFNKLYVRNFLCVSEITLDLSNLGSVLVEGINKDETCSISSGAGKSASFVEPILWCLFDRTVRGVKKDAVINEKAGKDCIVHLQFTSGNKIYDVVRYRKLDGYKVYDRLLTDTGINIFENGVDISKKKALDTDALISSIIGLSWEAFVSLILIGSASQGNFVTFSSLGPFDRILFLESFLPWLEIYAKAYQKALDLSNDLSSEENSLNSSLAVLDERIKEKQSKISSFEQESKTFELSRASKLSEIDQKITALKSKLETVVLALKENREKLSIVESKVEEPTDKSAEISELNSIININEIEKSKLKKMISNVANVVCDKCGQPISDDYRNKVVEESKLKILELDNSILIAKKSLEEILKKKSEEETRYRQCQSLLNELQHKISSLDTDEKLLKRELEILQSSKIEVEQSENRYLSLIEKEKTELLKAEKDFQELQKKLQDCLTRKEKVSLWVQGFSPSGVRSYILDSVLNFINERLSFYSSQIFEDNVLVKFVPSIIGNKTSIEIFLSSANFKNRVYSNCSGGEKRRADISIALAIRDFVQSYTNSNCNILIADEIIDSLDKRSSSFVLTCLKSVADNVFVISHSPDVKGLLDSVITVVKQNGQTTIAKGGM